MPQLSRHGSSRATTRLRRLGLILIGACIVLGAQVGVAWGLSYKPPRADVYFSNGGRILVMKSDGSDRRVLFGKNRAVTNDGLGGIDPVVSPDGETVVFGFRRELKYERLTDIWIMNADGTGARRILTSTKRVGYGDAGFAPGGRIILGSLSRTRKLGIAAVFTMEPDGSGRRTILKSRQRVRPWTSIKTFAEPVLSPDGSKLLYVLDPGYDDDPFREGLGSSLRVLNVETGRSRVLAEKGAGGDWSPDGKRIVYSEVAEEGDEEFCWAWDLSCLDSSRVKIVRADGKGSRLLTTARHVDERRPHWSDDGRIVFQSSRGRQWKIAETTEIWSVRPNGHCLTRLTNGTPASLDPHMFVPEGATSAPRGCNARPPGPNVELAIPETMNRGLWLGPAFQGLLVSDFGDERPEAYFVYGDCGRVPQTRCGRELFIDAGDICAARGFAVALFGSHGIQWQRGIPLFRSLRPGRETPPFTLGFTGRRVFYIAGGSGVGDRRNQHRLEIDALRPAGTDKLGGRLSAPKFPAGEVRFMKRVKRVFERTGSVPITAKRLKRGRDFVRMNLRAARRFEAAGGYETVNCPRKRRSDFGTGSASAVRPTVELPVLVE